MQSLLDDGLGLNAVDLFCGGGGLSQGLVDALKDIAVTANEPAEAVLEDRIDLVGVNHCEVALTTHEKNHPWARHIHDDIQHVDPSDVFDAPDPDVKVVCGGIECTHWSAARGGTPVDEQKRMPAWDVLTWIQKLQPENVLFENVPEFEKWGPVDDDGQPTRNGETFKAWTDALCSLGYSVDWQVLTAADYGDATTRKRLFVVGRRDHRATFPEPTHSETGAGDCEEWRSAAEIIDWSNLGSSIWERDRPLVNNTMRRIAEGIRRHCHDDLEPMASALDDLGAERDLDDGKDVILTSDLQDDVVPASEAAAAARERDRPFLVKGDVVAADGGEVAEDTCSGYLLGQQSGSRPRDVDETPVPTIATKGAIGLYQPDSFVLPRNGAYRGLDSNPAYNPEDRPLHTVTAKNHDGHLVTPYLVPYYSERDGQTPRTHDIDDPYPAVTATGSDPYLTQPFIYDYEGAPKGIDTPVGTITCRDKFALCVPECYPWGLDIRFRMLQPHELAAAQGFPDDYEFAGNKTQVTEQIGNAVPVNLAKALCEKLITGEEPSLDTFRPSQEVASDD